MGSKVKAKIENSLMRVRARGGFPSPHSFLHPPPLSLSKKPAAFRKKQRSIFRR